MVIIKKISLLFVMIFFSQTLTAQVNWSYSFNVGIGTSSIERIDGMKSEDVKITTSGVSSMVHMNLGIELFTFREIEFWIESGVGVCDMNIQYVNDGANLDGSSRAEFISATYSYIPLFLVGKNKFSKMLSPEITLGSIVNFNTKVFREYHENEQYSNSKVLPYFSVFNNMQIHENFSVKIGFNYLSGSYSKADLGLSTFGLCFGVACNFVSRNNIQKKF